MNPLLLAGALFAYACPADSYTFRVTLEGEGFASPLLGQGELEGGLDLHYQVLRRPAGGDPGEVRFRPDKVDLRWNGGRLPIRPEILDRLFRDRALAFDPDGLVTGEAAPALSASLGPLAIASLLPPVVLFPTRLPGDARLGTTWTEADPGAPFRRVTTLAGVEPAALLLTQRVEPLAGSPSEYRGTVRIRLDRRRGVAASTEFDLKVATAPGSDRTFSLRAKASEPEPAVARSVGPVVSGPLQTARGWFEDAVRWSGDRFADLRGYWTMLEVALRMSVGRLTDPDPLLGALRRRLGLPGGETR